MTATKVGIVYSANQQVIRRIIHYDHDSEASAHRVLLVPGEIYTEIPKEDYDGIKSHQLIHAYLGLSGISGVHDRCAVIDSGGNVKAIIAADPAIDSIDKHTLVAHQKAEVGGKLVNGIYSAPVSVL